MKFAVAGPCALTVGLFGCASITEGTSQDISVVTNPAGASCIFERQGMNIGTIPSTPATLNIPKRKYDVLIKCNKPGYEEASYLNHSGLTAVIAANVATDILLTAGLSSIIDSSTGADNKYDSAVNITLLPKSVVEASASISVNSPKSPVTASTAKPLFGVRGSTLKRNEGPAIYMKDPYGAWVEDVATGSAAGKAGIKRADVIQTFNGHRVSTFEELNDYVTETAPGSTARLGVWRNKEMILVPVSF